MLYKIRSYAAMGSKIVLITRSEQLASTLGTFKPYKMEPLSEDHAWSLFTKTACGAQDIAKGELEDIGREIVKKTGNIPLGVKVVASLLYLRDKDYWTMWGNMGVSEFQELVVKSSPAELDFHDTSEFDGTISNEFVCPLESETFSYVDPSTIIGRNEDKDAIAKMLLFDNQGEKITVIPIVGMAGVGKTTLAQLVYNDTVVTDDFEQKFWIWVGLDFNLFAMLKKVVEQRTLVHENIDLEQLSTSFDYAIYNKKFLIVLDDVCGFDRDVWLKFKNHLSACLPGSKIILTTRSEQVASILGTVKSHEVKPLLYDHAWSLFTSLAFSRGKDIEYPELVDIGREFIVKTGKVPLTIMILGYLLHHQDYSKWEALKNMEVPQYAKIVPILESTYNQLPLSIKQCLAYCAIFPKGYEIDKRQLLQLWITQGFVQLPLDDQNKSYEDIAEDWFNELQSWFFFKDFSRDQDNISFKMNELEFDLAQSIAANEIKVIHSMGDNTLPREIYHVSIEDSSDLQESVISTLPKGLRSFINVSKYPMHLTSSQCAQLLSRLKYLRALDLRASDISVVPNSIGSLKHLRYLNLSSNPFKSLPDSLTGLINLQVLDLSHCKDLEKLPRRLRRLVSLRHLYLGDCQNLACMPDGISQLTSLQTLSHFVIGKCKKNCNLDELGSMNLKAELTIVFANSV